MMKKLVLILAIATIGAFCMVGRSEATLLGIEIFLPDITSDATGTYTYNATTHLLTFSAKPLTITFDGGTLIDIIGTKSYSASFYVDGAGAFTGGVGGVNDLEIYGDIDVNYDGVNEYTGLLVAGEVTAFGFLDVPPTLYTLFDYTFDFRIGVGAALEPFYAGYDYKGGDIVTSDSKTFSGSWTSNHSGTKTKHDTAPTPEPASLVLLGAGLIGFAGIIRRKFKA